MCDEPLLRPAEPVGHLERVRVGRKRVERLMRSAGVSGYVKRRKYTTTIRVSGVRVADDLVGRDFNPAAPNRLWASDIKYVATWEGTLYLASVIECYSRRVVGWAMRADMQAELVVDALDMAVARRRPVEGLVHHSDQGSQPEFKGPSQRCCFTSLIVVPWPAVLDPGMSVGSASAIAEAA